MPITLTQLIIILPLVSAAAFIQGMVGFAFGIFAVPALTLAGMPLQHAVAVSVGATLMQTAWASWKLRDDIPWREATVATTARSLFLILGVWLLAHHLAPRPTLAKQVLGGALLTIVGVLWIMRVRPREHLHPLWAVLAFPLSGIMAGLFGMGGPPMILWATAHHWDTRRTRAFLLTTFFAACPIQIATLCFMFGLPVAYLIAIGAAMLPGIALGTHFGIQLGHRLSPARLRTVAFTILSVMALNAIIVPLLSR